MANQDQEIIKLLQAVTMPSKNSDFMYVWVQRIYGCLCS